MNRDTVLAILEQHHLPLKDLGVKSLMLFGSVARDEATSTSDVDILAEFESPITFDRYMDVKLYLEDQLGTKVDLVSLKSLKPQIRALVEREAIRVA
jgi:predicted nucleotidyltransferase